MYKRLKGSRLSKTQFPSEDSENTWTDLWESNAIFFEIV